MLVRLFAELSQSSSATAHAHQLWLTDYIDWQLSSNMSSSSANLHSKRLPCKWLLNFWTEARLLVQVDILTLSLLY